ncbi:MAG TPA: hypothetical protein VFI84_02420 [Candidatus Saccharimonadales bacterium]|nr:hypothetical protein [Candidatus Saccharimonadales bacterium]
MHFQMQKRIAVIIAIVVLVAAGTILLVHYIERSQNDIYYDKNGCMHSRSGRIAPTLCIKQ